MLRGPRPRYNGAIKYVVKVRNDAVVSYRAKIYPSLPLSKMKSPCHETKTGRKRKERRKRRYKMEGFLYVWERACQRLLNGGQLPTVLSWTIIAGRMYTLSKPPDKRSYTQPVPSKPSFNQSPVERRNIRWEYVSIDTCVTSNQRFFRKKHRSRKMR